MISIILSVDEKGTIGAGGKLPWRLPADLRYFRKLTLDHPIIMGRKTFESIGRPLDRRTNIVITRRSTPIEGVITAHSLDEAVCQARALNSARPEEIFVIGGAQIFALALPLADRLCITTVRGTFAGDARCPPIDFREWKTVSREERPADAENAYAMEFAVHERSI